MKTTLARGCLLVVASLVGCGDDDEDGHATATPVEACQSAVAVICKKVFGCLTDEQEALVTGIWGNNEADCRTKFEADRCDPEMVRCDSDETYSSSKASECIDQYEAMSCAEAGENVAPAACAQTCQ